VTFEMLGNRKKEKNLSHAPHAIGPDYASLDECVTALSGENICKNLEEI